MSIVTEQKHRSRKQFDPMNSIKTVNNVPAIEAGFFIEHILGMSEYDFKKQFGLDNMPSEKITLEEFFGRGNTSAEKWIAEHSMRRYIFQGEWHLLNIGTLRNGHQKLPFETSFKVIFFDPINPQECDLQKFVPEHPKSSVQVASTPMTFEGCSYMPDKTLSGIIKSPVQGEWCVITAPAQVIYRKYFMPFIISFATTSEKSNFLWEEFLGDENTAFPVTKSNHGGMSRKLNAKNIIEKMQKFGHQEDEILKSLKVGIQINSPISHGEIMVKNAEPKDHLIKAFDDPDLSANFVFTSAVNKSNFTPEDAENKHIKEFMGLALKAAYEGTALAANIYVQNELAQASKLDHTAKIEKLKQIDSHSRIVWFTLVGASAFRNPMNLIASAINSAGFLKAIQGLNSFVLFRAEKRKFDNQKTYGEISERTPEKDFQFLKEIYPLTGKKFNEDLIRKYLELSYGEVGVPISETAKTEISRIAAQLNA